MNCAIIAPINSDLSVTHFVGEGQCPSRNTPELQSVCGRGSDGSAVGGGNSDQSEWQRSADDEAAVSARNMPGTATGSLPLPYE